MKKLVLMLIVMVAFAVNADAQGFLNRLKDRAVRAAENAVERKVESKVDRTTSDAMDDVLDGKKGEKSSKKSKKSKNDDADEDEEVETEDTYDPQAGAVKSDFVRGSVVMFEDDMSGEQVGEFPSKWDLVRGNAEIATIKGQKCIALVDGDGWITPLVKGGIKNYLGDMFTVEYDMLFDDRPKDGAPGIELDIMNENEKHDHELFTIHYNMAYDKQTIDCDYVRPTEEGFSNKEGTSTAHEACVINDGRWHHFALSFNKRAIKFYVDGKRVINVPNAKAGAGWLTLWSGGKDDRPTYVKNVVIAKGAVDLYERNATDIDAKVAAVEKAIAETGKFVTNNILFETAKATLKPESMEEIQKVAEYMKKNPSVRFEVQGHTDNQGSDAVNDPLSQQRAEAVVKALEGLGVDGFNLRAVGKGSHEPVADNKTEAGRAQNRRVVFVKK
jgi:outer membrane protein OmpA-like peptidoglycan-associated protein